MNNLYKNFVWVIVFLFSLAILISLTYQNQAMPVDMAIADIAGKIKAGEIVDITVSGNDLEATLKDGGKLTSRKEPELGLTQTLINYGVTADELSAVKLNIKGESGLGYWLSILLPILLPFMLIIGIFWFITRQAKGGINQAFTFGRANLRAFLGEKDGVTFADVAGLKEAKQELEEVVDFLKNPKKYLDIGAKIPRGVLLMGSPGTGKTLLAKAVAGEAKVPFFHISASEFVEMFVGVGASRTRDAFNTAKAAAPAILFIDEIDAVGRERGAGLGGGNDEREQTLNQILVEMDGFDRNTQVIVLAATNRPDVLDPALLRPGRFDRRVVLDLPDLNEREAILKIHAKNKPLDKDIDFHKVASRTPGFSGADLANLLNEAAILAVKEKKKIVNQQNIYESIEKVILGPARRSRLITEKEKSITAYHEAGHALVAAGLKDSDPIHKISIVSRGRTGGYTMKLPLEEERLRTRTQFLTDLAMMMGGYASEKLVFGDITTGASNDLKEASNLARLLVTRYGMSEKLGPQVFGKSDELVFLGREISSEKNYSEAVATEIDNEVKKFLDHAYKTALKVLTAKRTVLDKITTELMKKETLEQEEFYDIIKSFNLKPLKA
jgi:cell division protease FtsH